MDTERDQVRHDVAEWLASYQPQGIPTAEWADAGLRAFVTEQIIRLDPPGVPRAKKCALQLAKLARWCHRHGMDLDVEQVLHPDTVERYCEVALANDPHRGDYRSMLRSIGPVLTKKAPWQPPPVAMKSRKVAAPYDAETVAGFVHDMTRQSTPRRRQSFTAMVALGLGAGLDGRWLHLVYGSDVDQIDGTTMVEVPDPAPRVVPVRDAWAATVRELAEQADDGLLFGGERPRKNLVNRRASDFDLSQDTPKPNAARLRSTWLVAHLAAGTRLPELVEAAGLQGITTLSDLLPAVERLDPGQARALLQAV